MDYRTGTLSNGIAAGALNTALQHVPQSRKNTVIRQIEKEPIAGYELHR